MKYIIIFLIAVSSVFSVFAQSRSEAITNMHQQCRCVMEGGVCQVLNNTNPPKPGEVVFTSKGAISAEVYNAIRNRGPAMCADGLAACTASWDSETCRAGFRLMFRQEPTVCLSR